MIMMMMVYNKDAIWRQSNGLTLTLWLDDDDNVDDDGDDDDDEDKVIWWW